MRPQRWVTALVTMAAVIGVVVPPWVPLREQPYPDAQLYASSSYHLATGDGYVAPEVHEPLVYPPGFALLLAPFARWRYPIGAQVGAKVYALALLLVICWGAWAVGGEVAACAAALLVVASPFVPAMGRLVMSDLAGAALTVLGLCVLSRGTDKAAFGSGVIAGLAMLVRFAGVTTLVALLISCGRRSLKWSLLGAVPVVSIVVVQQWAASGAGSLSTYRDANAGFSVHHLVDERLPADGDFYVADGRQASRGLLTRPRGVVSSSPNALFYPLVLTGLDWVFYPALLPLLAVGELWRRRATPGSRYVAAAVSLNTGLFLTYGYQSARFVAPSASLLICFAGGGISRVAKASRLWRLRFGLRSSGSEVL